MTQDVRNFVLEDVDIIIHNCITRSSILVQVNSIHTNIDSTHRGSIELIKIASYGHCKRRSAAKSRGRRPAHVQHQVNVWNPGRNMLKGDLCEFRISTVFTIFEFTRSNFEVAADRYDTEGLRPKVSGSKVDVRVA